MEHIPVELWLNIHSLACTDGGYTACSLRLVSRRMRAVVDPVRFTSVSLTNERQLFAFSHLLPADDRNESAQHSSFTITHLLVAVPTRYWGMDVEEMGKALRRQETIRKLLAAAAPSLRSFTLYSTALDLVAFELNFPALEDLSVERFDSIGRHLPILPSLRRLHLTQYLGLSSFWPLLARVAPALTHIRLTGVSQDTELPRFLRNLFDLPVPVNAEHVVSPGLVPPYPPGTPEATAAKTLSSLRVVIVEPVEYTRDIVHANGLAMHLQMMAGLGTAEEECRRGSRQGTLYILPSIFEYLATEARREWLHTVEGGSGPWATPEERAAGRVIIHEPSLMDRINSAFHLA